MLTLDQIKAEAERVFGSPLNVVIDDDRTLWINTPDGRHGVDLGPVTEEQLSLPLQQFSDRRIEPAMVVLCHIKANPQVAGPAA
jgi:hypothetical protein